MKLLHAILIASSVLTIPQSVWSQAASARMVDFASLKECYAKIRHTTPSDTLLRKLNVQLTSVPVIHFVEQAPSKIGKIDINALVIQERAPKDPGRTRITVIQQRPLAGPGFVDKAKGKLFGTPFVEKDEFVVKRATSRHGIISNHDCQADINSVKFSVERNCLNGGNCSNVALELKSQYKIAGGKRVPSPCVPKVVVSKKKGAGKSPLPDRDVETSIRKALISHMTYMTQNYNAIIGQNFGEMVGAHTASPNDLSKNPGVVQFKQFTSGLRQVLSAEHPIGACQKILVEPDPQLQALNRQLFCKAARGTKQDCEPSTAPANSTETDI